jgi:hypothetical protein
MILRACKAPPHKPDLYYLRQNIGPRSVQKRSIPVNFCSKVFKTCHSLLSFAPFLHVFFLPALPKPPTLTPCTPFFAQEPTQPSETTQKSRKNPKIYKSRLCYPPSRSKLGTVTSFFTVHQLVPMHTSLDSLRQFNVSRILFTCQLLAAKCGSKVCDKTCLRAASNLPVWAVSVA